MKNKPSCVFGCVRVDINGPIALLTLKKPSINVLDETDLHNLAEAVNMIEHEDCIRSVLITSGIYGVFCAGGDLNYWPNQYPDQPDTVSEAGRFVFDRLQNLAKPTIAVIDGQVIGDGISLALACDIRLAGPRVSFHLPEIEYGFIPGWGTIGRLLQAAGRSAAVEMVFLGDPITARRARHLGLIHRIFTEEDLMPAAMTMAKRLAQKPPKAMQFAKTALNGDFYASSEEQAALELQCFSAVWGGPEWQTGVIGFAKAKPASRSE
jgi:enoyl-CoA hydratase/carnithine racemase